MRQVSNKLCARRLNERMHGGMHAWMNAWKNEWMNDRMDGWMNGWMKEGRNRQMNKCMNERTNGQIHEYKVFAEWCHWCPSHEPGLGCLLGASLAQAEQAQASRANVYYDSASTHILHDNRFWSSWYVILSVPGDATLVCGRNRDGIYGECHLLHIMLQLLSYWVIVRCGLLEWCCWK